MQMGMSIYKVADRREMIVRYIDYGRCNEDENGMALVKEDVKVGEGSS